jgi:hypothetical protein
MVRESDTPKEPNGTVTPKTIHNQDVMKFIQEPIDLEDRPSS